MRADTSTFRYFILGLLARQPMSGYDIRRFLKSLSWLVSSPSFGSLYPALHALLEDGLVTVQVVPREDKPPRKIYSITDAGRTGLQTWIGQPVASSTSLKAFVMRLILANNFPLTGLITYLEQRREQVADYHTALERTVSTSDGTDLGQHLALDYGIAMAAAELAWLDRTLNGLPQQPECIG